MSFLWEGGGRGIKATEVVLRSPRIPSQWRHPGHNCLHFFTQSFRNCLMSNTLYNSLLLQLRSTWCHLGEELEELVLRKNHERSAQLDVTLTAV